MNVSTLKPPADWAEIAKDYLRGDLTIDELCARHAITTCSLYRQIKKEGWPLRRPPVTQDSHALGPRPARGSKSTNRRALFFRLCRALDQKIAEFEQSRPPPEALTPADKEREARTLHAMIRMFEKLSAMNPAVPGKTGRSGTEANTKGRLNDADELRRQLAERLDRLRRGRDAGTVPQKPES